ncbi:MAG: cupin domain-containing protein [Rubricoccaceae bacterium]|nr:cupin domain-containing protein [Rubricoccaceae bacterium]
MRLSLLLLVFAVLGAVPAAAQPSDAVFTPYDALEWVEIVPGVTFAATHGDMMAEAHGKLIRFDAGVSTPVHTHTNAYHGVVIQGRVTNPYSDDEALREMGAGDYWYVPGGAPHRTACVSEEPCLFYTYGDAAWDVAVLED